MTDFDDIEPNLPPAKSSRTAKKADAKVRKPQTVTAPGKVRLVVEENDSIPPTGLFLGLNGIGYLLRPGEEVEVPLGVKEILDHAVMSTPQMDPSTQQVIGYRERMRYPYRLVTT
jgi:hypothetical protein